jgi:hypothetical protein
VTRHGHIKLTDFGLSSYGIFDASAHVASTPQKGAIAADAAAPASPTTTATTISADELAMTSPAPLRRQPQLPSTSPSSSSSHAESSASPTRHAHDGARDVRSLLEMLMMRRRGAIVCRHARLSCARSGARRGARRHCRLVRAVVDVIAIVDGA